MCTFASSVSNMAVQMASFYRAVEAEQDPTLRNTNRFDETINKRQKTDIGEKQSLASVSLSLWHEDPLNQE